MDTETRINTETAPEVRKTDTGRVIFGYAAVFNSLSHDLGGFREKIAPGAFTESLADDPDVSARIQHAGGVTTVGRTRSGTLKVWQDDKGIPFELDVPDTNAGRDMEVLIERGDIDKASFAFTLRGENADEWDFESDPPIRTLLNLDLHDVAPVDGPAYEATSVGVRAQTAETLEEARAAMEAAKAAQEPPEPTQEDLNEMIVEAGKIKSLQCRDWGERTENE
ncbi:MAG: HK97 family phage prohead protease [Chloroflexi bacterium]|nr:HK97 family phage prohead protease [Chloroflexota bacterium]